ncbi:GntR family transcriptional regulator [Coriobacteriales bacterium OH1046]|nr:GntR family transcriptional regulator [Coriobacteriales bacterium OH1046]
MRILLDDSRVMLKVGSRNQTAELVEAYIIDHGLLPGDKLPSEREMCEMWGLNRMTLRNALKRLSNLGIVESRASLGMFVAPPKMVRNLQDTIGFSQAVREAGRVPGHRVIGCELIEANKFVVRHLRVILASPTFVIKRVNTIDGHPVAVETSWINAQHCKGIEAYDFSTASLYGVLEDRYGIIPTSGTEKISVTKVDEEEADLLGVRGGDSAFFQTGLILDQHERPVEYFKNVVLPSRISFSTELRRMTTSEA